MIKCQRQLFLLQSLWKSTRGYSHTMPFLIGHIVPLICRCILTFDSEEVQYGRAQNHIHAEKNDLASKGLLRYDKHINCHMQCLWITDQITKQYQREMKPNITHIVHHTHIVHSIYV